MSSEKIHSLVRKAKSGDREAFGDLYEIYSREMFSFARWYLGDTYFAEDAVSEAAISAFVSVKNLKETDKFKSWLFTILLRKCQKMLKDIIGMRQTSDIEEVNETAKETSPEQRAELKEALSVLGDEDREILLLSSLGNLTSTEIGEMLGIPSGTIRSKLSRATDKLYDVLSERSAKNG